MVAGEFQTVGPKVHGPDVTRLTARLVAELRDRLQVLKGYAAAAPSALESVCKIVLAFLTNPLCLQNRFINLMVLGSPGTGKTTICEKIADVLVAARIVNSPLSTKSKADFIGTHLGETRRAPTRRCAPTSTASPSSTRRTTSPRSTPSAARSTRTARSSRARWWPS